MPVFEAELSDGRTVTVEADSPPTEQEILSSIGNEEPKQDAMEMPSMGVQPRFAPTLGERFQPQLPVPATFQSAPDVAPQRAPIFDPAAIEQARVDSEKMLTANPGLKDIVPTGEAMSKATGIPQIITTPVSAVGRLAGSVGDFALSPQGVSEMATAATPAGPAVLAKWGYDMLKSGLLTAKDLGTAIDDKLGEWIGHQMRQAAGGGTTEYNPETNQRIAEDVVNSIAMLAGGGKATKGAIMEGLRVPTNIRARQNAFDTEAAINEFARNTESQPLLDVNQLASSRLGLPPRATPEMLPELQRTKELVDRAIQEATQKIQVPGQIPALDLLKAQDIQLIPEAQRNLAERTAAPGESVVTPTFQSGLQVQPGFQRSASDLLLERNQEAMAPTPKIPEPPRQEIVSTTNPPYRQPKAAPTQEQVSAARKKDRAALEAGMEQPSGYYVGDEPLPYAKEGQYPAEGMGQGTLSRLQRSRIMARQWKKSQSGQRRLEPTSGEGVVSKEAAIQEASRFFNDNVGTLEATPVKDLKGVSNQTLRSAAGSLEMVIRNLEEAGISAEKEYKLLEKADKELSRRGIQPPPAGFASETIATKGGQNATVQGKVEGLREPQHQGIGEGRAPEETINRNSPEPSGNVQEAPKVELAVDAMSPSELAKMSHKDGIAYGDTLTEADVPRLQAKYDEASRKTVEAAGKNDSEAMKAEYGKSIFYGGALMGATKGKHPISGINYDLYLKQKELSTEPRQGTSPAVEPPKVEEQSTAPVKPAAPIDKAISGIESLQAKLRKGPQSGQTLMGVPSAILDTALEAARLSLKAGKSVAEAIDAAIKHIRFNVKEFNEKQVRAMLEKELGQSAVGKSEVRTPVADLRKTVQDGTAAKQVSPSQPAEVKKPTTVDETLKKIANVFEPAPKEKTPIKVKASNVIESVRTGVSSKFRPINKLAEDVAKAYGLSNPKDIAGIMEQLKGSQGKGEADVYRFDRDVSSLVKGDEKAFSEYVFARRALDRLKQDQKDINAAIAGEDVPHLNRRNVGNFTINELEPALKAIEDKLGPEKLKKFKEAADQYQRYMDDALRLQVESGRMSEKVYNAIKEGNQFYAPFKVMKYLEESSRPEGSGKKIDTVADFTKAMKGIEDPNFKLGDMLAAARQSIIMSRILADKNMAMRHVAELATHDVNGTFIKKLNAIEDAPQGMEAVNVLENGVKKRYAVNSDAAKAIQLYGGTSGGVLSRTLSAFSVPFRAGATALNLPFQISNLLADQPRVAFVSKYGLRGLQDFVHYPLDFIHSLYSSIAGDVFGKENKLFLDFLDSGVAGTTVQEYLTPDALKFKEPTAVSKSRKLASSVLNVIPEFAQAIEQTSKIMGVKRAMRFEGIKSGKELAKQIPEAITELRRFSGSPDFGRQGKFVESARLNLLYMFLNARIQGAISDVGRLAGVDGGRTAATTWLRIASAVGIPTAMLYYLNNQKDNKADYDSRSEQEKQNYWLIPKVDENGKPRYVTTEEGEKVRDYWRIPKRESSKWIANLTESALNFAQNRNPKAAKDFGAQMLQEISPVNIQGDTAQERLESVASSLNPVIKAPLELATGRDMYRHRPIMSDQLKKASPEQQFTERTPEFFKKLADAMPDASPELLRSPIVLENLTRNLTAGLLTQFMARQPIKGRTAFENTPLLQRFQSIPITDSKEFQEDIKDLSRQAADEQLIRHREATKLIEDNPGKKLEDIVPLALKGKKSEDLKPTDVKLVKQVVDLWIAKENGATVKDRQVIALPTHQRALWVQQQLSGLQGEALNMKIQELARKRIYTEGVAKELSNIMESK
jgi:hypothetical protein